MNFLVYLGAVGVGEPPDDWLCDCLPWLCDCDCLRLVVVEPVSILPMDVSTIARYWQVCALVACIKKIKDNAATVRVGLFI